jgi:hypothetical protein
MRPDSANPLDFLAVFIARFRTDFHYLTVVQQWSRGGSSVPLPVIIELDSGAADPRREFLIPLALEGGNSLIDVLSYL